MSIRTKRGDQGETDLFFFRRVPKTDFRITAVGSIDECTSAIGLARVLAPVELAEEIGEIQQLLITLMGELSVDSADLERYLKAGHKQVDAADIQSLEERIKQIEEKLPQPKGWSIPGAVGSELAARFDFARSVVRRAERDVLDLAEAEIEKELNPEILRFLNTLSDFLWLLGREAEEAHLA